jgi:DNA-binding PadR family transcriptional regulator
VAAARRFVRWRSSPRRKKALANGLVKAEWTRSETGREVRTYRLTVKGEKTLKAEEHEYRRLASAVSHVLESA